MSSLADELVRSISAERSVSVQALAATNLVREAVGRHATSPAASVALARALMGGVLLAAQGQDGERVQIRIRGDGPLGGITVTAESDGRVRGYLQHPDADPPLRGETLGVAEGIGLGALHVERNHRTWKQPYSGIVPLVTGEIAQDLAHYLVESEQKPSALALGVYLSPGGEVQAAGGYLVQPLPDASDADLARMERRVAGVHPAELLRGGGSADTLLERLLDGPPAVPPARSEPRFHCPCDLERVKRAALLLGRDEIREIARTGETLEVRCAFCAEVYRVPPDELGALLPDA